MAKARRAPTWVGRLDDLPRCRLLMRPRDAPGCLGHGLWSVHTFASEGERLWFVTLWEHDFEMALEERSDLAR